MTYQVPELQDDTYRIYEHGYLNFFVDKVYYFQAPNELTQSALDLSRQQRAQGEHSYVKRLAGDLQEEYLLWSVNNPVHPEFADSVQQMFQPHCETIVKEKCQGLLNDVWVNFQKSGEHNPLHKHSGTFSFVWYLDIPQEIRDEHLAQTSSTRSRGMIEFTAERSNDVLRFNPKSNDVFLFRSDHNHQVYPFYSNNERISVAGNINVVF
jgi:hypothetical protein